MSWIRTLIKRIPDSGKLIGLSIPIPDPGPRITDPTTATKGEGKKCCLTFFCGYKFHTIEEKYIFLTGKEDSSIAVYLIKSDRYHDMIKHT
jgi:hypothetical protein